MADDPHKESPESESQTDDSSNKGSPSQPISSAKVQVPQSTINHNDSQKHKQECRQRWKFRFQTLTVIVITLYTIIAGIQACQMRRATEAARESTDLLRKQLVGTQAANVALRLSIYPNNALSVMFDHRGVVAAREVRFVFHAIRKRIPGLEEIEAAITHTAYEPILSPQQIYAPKEYSLPGFTPSVMDAIRRTEQTIMVTGQFSYDNGFGDMHREEICMYWLTGIPNRTSDQGGANEFFPCEDFPVRLSNVLKSNQEMQANKQE